MPTFNGRYIQHSSVVGDDIVMSITDSKGIVVGRRVWADAAKYVVGRRPGTTRGDLIVIALPERAGINIKAG